MIRRRHVFYLEGYDPQGAEGYHRLFRREWKRFIATWPLDGQVGDLTIDSDDFAHWDIEANGPNWQVSTRYEFLRLEAVIRANMTQPLMRQLRRALRWIFDDLVSGAMLRIFKASWRFGVHLIYAQGGLVLWAAISLAGGLAAGYVAARLLDWPLAAVPAATVVTFVVFMALRSVFDRWRVLQVTNGWPYLREFARGAQTSYDRPIGAFAARIVAATRAAEADEILVVAHSAGGPIAMAVMARALELDPDLGRHGPRVTLLTVGSLLPAFALHPAAEPLRGFVRRLAVDPAVRWVDCQSRKDNMNFWNFDPVGGVGLDVGAERRNPTIWPVRLRDMLTDAVYDRLRHNHFRMHYQYVMANDRRAPYDYFLLICGPVAVTQWAARPEAVFREFSPEGAYTPAPCVPSEDVGVAAVG